MISHEMIMSLSGTEARSIATPMHNDSIYRQTQSKRNQMITYHLDYRSPPAGLGTITLDNKDMILLQAQDEQIEVKDGIYSKIIVLNNVIDDFEELQQEVIETLLSYDVSHVYDAEEWDSGITDKNGYLHIRDYINMHK